MFTLRDNSLFKSVLKSKNLIDSVDLKVKIVVNEHGIKYFNKICRTLQELGIQTFTE